MKQPRDNTDVKNLKVLVVDDSPVVRQAVKRALENNACISEVQTSSNGTIAIKKVRKHNPDVITMDIEMPGMDGIDTLKHIMREHSIPVIMLSAFTFEGAEKTIKALELGAVDFIQKPGARLSSDIVSVTDELIAKICAVVKTRPSVPSEPKGDKLIRPQWLRPSVLSGQRDTCGVLALGASTGGTEAIRRVLTKLPADLPVGIVIVQHMPPGFTRAFANRLDELCALEVKEASSKDLVLPGRVLIAPGHSHMTVQKGQFGLFVELHRTQKVNGHMPSVDVLFDSVAQIKGVDIASVLFTGMGRDGALGTKNILESGGYTIAQDNQSSVVFGMPKAAIELDAVLQVVPLGKIAPVVAKLFRVGRTVNVRPRKRRFGRRANVPLLEKRKEL